MKIPWFEFFLSSFQRVQRVDNYKGNLQLIILKRRR